MPELPEVETIRRELEPIIVGKTFAEPLLHMPTTIACPSPAEFISGLDGRKITGLGRRGKYLLINLDCGILVVHLRMTGNLVYVEKDRIREERFLRVSLPFKDGSALYYSDMRRFGRLWLVYDNEELETGVLKNIGPDIVNELSRDEFINLVSKKERRGLKALLLDQGFAAGMGNIYTDECLFRCGVHPSAAAGTLSCEEAGKLYDEVQAVLAEGIEFGGTTFRDYRNASGALGDFQSRLNVYNRKGEKCRCGTPIEKTVVAGRGTYFCPRCQKLNY